MLSLWVLQGGLCGKTSWSVQFKTQLVPAGSTKPTKDQLSPSITCGVLSKICVKRLKTARYRKNKKWERLKGIPKSKQEREEDHAGEDLRIATHGRLVLSVPKPQLGISDRRAEYRGATLEQRKCEEKAQAEGTDFKSHLYPQNHLVRTMIFWSAGLMNDQLQKRVGKGIFKSFFSVSHQISR